MMVDPTEAAEQLAYVRRLSERTRLRLADTGPALVIWGSVWTVGYAGTAVGLFWAWLAIFAAPVAQYFVYRRRPQPIVSPPDVTLLFQVLVIYLVGVSVVAVVFIFPSGDGNLIGAYFPIVVGFQYIMLSVYAGRTVRAVGAWLIVIGLVSLPVPYPVDAALLAVGAGGVMVATGLLIERVLRLSPDQS